MITDPRPTDSPAEAAARKALKPLGIALALTLALIVFASCVGSSDTPAAPTPVAPAATVVPAVTASATPAESDAVAILKATYSTLPAKDRKAVQDAWAAAEGDPVLERFMAREFAESMTAFPVTTDEAAEFLRWAATQR